MLSSSYRFHGRNSLKFVNQRGQTIRGQMLSLKYAKNSRRAEYRVAVIVSRKVSGSAVVRNRIRRRIYACLQDQNEAIEEAYDLVFIALSSEVAEMDSKQLEKMVKDCLAQAGVIKSRSTKDRRDIINREEK